MRNLTTTICLTIAATGFGVDKGNEGKGCLIGKNYLTHRLQTDFRIFLLIELGVGYFHSLSGLLSTSPVPPPIGSL